MQKAPTLPSQLFPGYLMGAMFHKQSVDDLGLPSQFLLGHLPLGIQGVSFDMFLIEDPCLYEMTDLVLPVSNVGDETEQ